MTLFRLALKNGALTVKISMEEITMTLGDFVHKLKVNDRRDLYE
jgi:hypothetical protein